MSTIIANQRLDVWVDEQLAKGQYSFSLDKLREIFAGQSDTALKFALKRLTDKGKILSVYKGYYIIIPAQYLHKGIIPPTMFLDAFMKELKRPYYIGLLNAAAFYGASHQQPQEFFVITSFPVLRPMVKKGLIINYISVRNFPDQLLEKRKTEAGYINISNPGLTATDLIQFEKRIGGINRAATVINELSETMTSADFDVILLSNTPVTALQRLGYLLEFACENQKLANALYDIVFSAGLKLYRIPLKASGKVAGFSSDNRWQVIVNTAIDIDE
ncbi:MAG: type IV toxin-antitoxin system AbiEi family antitoxin [Saprospiraceae bacterium]